MSTDGTRLAYSRFQSYRLCGHNLVSLEVVIIKRESLLLSLLSYVGGLPSGREQQLSFGRSRGGSMIGSSYYRTAEARTAHHTCGFTHKVKLAGQQKQRLRQLCPL